MVNYVAVWGVRFKYENATVKEYFEDFELMKKKTGIEVAEIQRKGATN